MLGNRINQILKEIGNCIENVTWCKSRENEIVDSSMFAPLLQGLLASLQILLDVPT
jgi:hypothetical protein